MATDKYKYPADMGRDTFGSTRNEHERRAIALLEEGDRVYVEYTGGMHGNKLALATVERRTAKQLVVRGKRFWRAGVTTRRRRRYALEANEYTSDHNVGQELGNASEYSRYRYRLRPVDSPWVKAELAEAVERDEHDKLVRAALGYADYLLKGARNMDRTLLGIVAAQYDEVRKAVDAKAAAEEREAKRKLCPECKVNDKQYVDDDACGPCTERRRERDGGV